MKPQLLYIFLAILLTLSTNSGCQNLSVPEAGNVLLITLDTTRADSLGCYGNSEISTPNLDAIAAQGLLFENAYTTCPMTLPAHSSILTGRYPFTHGVRNNTHYLLSDENQTIAEVLKNKGYRTAAFIGSTILSGDRGLDQGFDKYCDNMFSGVEESEIETPWAARKAANVNYDFKNWLVQYLSEKMESDKFFAWVHYYDPHYRYEPEEPYLSEYAENPYYGEIAYVDEKIGEIIDLLKSNNLYDNTLIIIAGDHGEGLGEHGEDFHGIYCYDTTLKVPLIISAPEYRANAGRIATRVSNSNIYETINSWCGGQFTTGSSQDLLIFNTEDGDDSGPWTFYFESYEARINYGWAGLAGTIMGDYKLIWSPTPELYNLIKDPLETENIYTPDNRYYEDVVLGMYDSYGISDDIFPTGNLPTEDIEMLESLGYISGGSLSLSNDELISINGLDDVKDKSEIIKRISVLLEEGNYDYDTGDFSSAREKYLELLTYVENYTSLSNLGEIETYFGNFDEAAAYFKLACGISPEQPEAWYNLGVAYRNNQQGDLSIEAFNLAISLGPDDPVNSGSHVALAVYMSENGDWKSALDEIIAAKEICPDESAMEISAYEASILFNLAAWLEIEAIKIASPMQMDSSTVKVVDPSEYSDLLIESAGYYHRSYQLYKEYLEVNSGSSTQYYEAALAASHQEDFDRALEWLQAAYELLPQGDPNRDAMRELISKVAGRIG